MLRVLFNSFNYENSLFSGVVETKGEYDITRGLLLFQGWWLVEWIRRLFQTTPEANTDKPKALVGALDVACSWLEFNQD